MNLLAVPELRPKAHVGRRALSSSVVACARQSIRVSGALVIGYLALGCGSARVASAPPQTAQRAPNVPLPNQGGAPAALVPKLASAPAQPPDGDSEEPQAAQSRGAQSDAAASTAPPAPAELPAAVSVGEFTRLDTPDGPVEVLHAPASVRRALVYLHGACGNARAAEAFKATLSHYATLIAVYGERSCGSGHPGRFYWNGRAQPLMRRIDSALTLVAEQRSGLLDTQQPLLFGYSQGSEVAQLLTERWPERFPEVILGGVPSTPNLQSLARLRSVAIVGGSREFLTPMRTGEWLLTHNHVRAKLFVLKGAKHGSFGRHAERDLSEVFGWLLSAPDSVGAAQGADTSP